MSAQRFQTRSRRNLRTQRYPSYTANRYAEGEWSLPLITALLLHLLLAAASIYAPDIFKSKPQFAEVHTVSLIEIASESPPPAASSPAAGQKSEKQPAVKPAQKAEQLKAARKKVKKEVREETPEKPLEKSAEKEPAQKQPAELKTAAETIKKISTTADRIARKKNIVAEEKPEPVAQKKQKEQNKTEEPAKQVSPIPAESTNEGKVVSLTPRRKKIRHQVKEEVEEPSQAKKEQENKKREAEKLAEQKRDQKRRAADAKKAARAAQAKRDKAAERAEAARRVEELRREQAARHKREEKLLAEQAALAREKQRLAKQALEDEKALLRSSASTSRMANRKKSGSGSNSSAKRANSGGSSVIANQYFAKIKNHLLSYWALPVTLQNRTLEATVVVTINKDGRIVDMFFEKRSGERVFDQFVEKTVQAANPLAPIPAAMHKERVEIGFKFSPRGIQ